MANTISSLDLFVILCAGILPVLLWLWFWLKEDSKRPEPRKLLVLSFFGGALAIILVIPLQGLAKGLLPGGLVLLLAWALIEEASKYLVAYTCDFRNKAYDEPLDAMIYLVTVALGFAAFENVLFLAKSLTSLGLGASLLTASMRFVGATLLHVFASATLGGVIAMSYFKTKREKIMHTIFGLIMATALHTMFNFFIMNQLGTESSDSIIAIFAILWIGIAFLLLFFEKVRAITCKLEPKIN